jgi:hypothetical protein
MGALASLVTHRLALVFVLSASGLAIFGCGGSGGDHGAEQLAKQEELKAARQEAAQNARQSAKIAALERKLKSHKQHAEPVPQSQTPVDEPVEAEEPLAGLWKGEAAITYDSGESDPFNETIQINSLVLGQVAGYAEAHQGSTTCHGPLTYQGTSGGWYHFSAEERNVAECIDYSQVDLMPDGSGGLSYRESTEVSVSTGQLEQVR